MQLTLYDNASKEGKTWSPNVWKTRLLLNFKGIDYQTEWLHLPDIAPTLKAFGIQPHAEGTAPSPYTIPAIRLRDGHYIMDSKAIADELEKLYPEPSAELFSPALPKVEEAWIAVARPLIPILTPLTPRTTLVGPSIEYYRQARQKGHGMSLEELEERSGGEQAWEKAMPGLNGLVEILNEVSTGPFVLGEKPSYADFLIVAFLQWCKVVKEEVFQRIVEIDPSLQRIYEACQPWLERNDH